jgi:hypothetical protein
MHSAWRSSEALVSGTNLTAMRAFAPYMASYLNEASVPYENFKRVFWGDSYDRLLTIKLKYDSKDVFFVTPGIGADEWWVDAARLCRHERKLDQEMVDPFAAVSVDGSFLEPAVELPSREPFANLTRHIELRPNTHAATEAPQSRRTMTMPFSGSTVIVMYPPPETPSSAGAVTKASVTSKPYTWNPTAKPTPKPNTISIINLSDLKTLTNSTSTVYTLPYPEGDNTNTNSFPLAKYLLPGPFVTPWPTNQASADNYQRSALARLSTMRESSLRDKGFSQFGYSYLMPGMSLHRPTSTPTAFIPINLTPKMPAWSPGTAAMAPPAPQFTTVSGNGFTADYKASTTTGHMSSFSEPVGGTITSKSSTSTISSASSSSVSTIASRPKGPSTVSGPGGRPAAVPKPKSPAPIGPAAGERLTDDFVKPRLEDGSLEDSFLEENNLFFS